MLRNYDARITCKCASLPCIITSDISSNVRRIAESYSVECDSLGLSVVLEGCG